MKDRREAILAIALPTPPAPITRAFMIEINSKQTWMRAYRTDLESAILRMITLNYHVTLDTHMRMSL